MIANNTECFVTLASPIFCSETRKVEARPLCSNTRSYSHPHVTPYDAPLACASSQNLPTRPSHSNHHFNMECLFGITGKDFVLVASDTMAVRSIVVMKSSEKKYRKLNDNTVMLYTGEPGDTVAFAEYIERNIRLYGIRNSTDLGPKEAAAFTRKELAEALRSRVSS